MDERNSTNALRDFIFIDKDRLYSLYSQVFKGIAESIVESFSISKEDTEREKKLEQSISDSSQKIRNVVLFDHIYNSLEEELTSQLLVVDENTEKAVLVPGTFVKVTGTATLEDFERLLFFMKNFNEIGLAIATMQISNNSKQKTNASQTNSKNSIEQYAKSNGLMLEKKYTESIVKIIENFHGIALDITIEPHSSRLDAFFKATLDEKNMRISSNVLRQTYGYKPMMDWTIVGEITNVQNNLNETHSGYSNTFTDMFTHIDEIDNSFEIANDKNNSVIRIAPIAVYIEHNNTMV